MPQQMQNVWEIHMYGQSKAGTEPAKKINNVFHYTIGAATTSLPSNDQIQAQFMVSVANRVLGVVTSDYLLNAVGVRLMDIYENVESNYPINQPGLVSTSRLPLFSSVVVHKQTALRGRNYIGRNAFSCVPESHVSSDVLNAAGLTAWQPIADGMLLSWTIGSTVVQPAVFSKSPSQLMKNPIVLYGSIVIKTTLNTVIGTMRRRKEKTSV